MIALITPPVSDCFMPLLGASQNAGYLRSRGHSVRVFDFGAELLSFLVSDVHLSQTLKKSSWKNLEHSVRDCFSEQIKWKTGVPTEIYTILQSRLRLLSYCSDSPIVSPDSFLGMNEWRSGEKLRLWLNDNGFFSRIYRSLPLYKDLLDAVDEYVGFSITFESQLIPAMGLAQTLRRDRPDLKTVFGGSFFYSLGLDELLRILKEVPCGIDHLVVGPGEPFWDGILTEARDNDGKHRLTVGQTRVFYSEKTRPFPQPLVYPPCFDGIDFQKYLSPVPAIPFMLNDRCYYGKCNFCNGDRLLKGEHTRRRLDTLFPLIEESVKATGVEHVYFADAAFSPRELKWFADHSNDIGFHWIANARFEQTLADPKIVHDLVRSGCRMLRFGLESASQRMVDAMNKGFDVNLAQTVLEETSRHGINSHLYVMYGYVDETKEDRERTRDFMCRNRGRFFSWSLSYFTPVPETPVYIELDAKDGRPGKSFKDIGDLAYGGEENYHAVLKDGKDLVRSLKNHVHDNGIFYSGNLFSAISRPEMAEVTIRSGAFRFGEIVPDFDRLRFVENKLQLRLKHVFSDPVCFFLIDLFSGTTLAGNIPEAIAALLRSDYDGTFEVLTCRLDGEEKALALAVLDALSEVSAAVRLWGIDVPDRDRHVEIYEQ